MSTEIEEQWKQIAIEIGNEVYRTVNTSATVGTEDETGYLLMFFNADHHDGRSSFVSTAPPAELKKLLKTALRKLKAASEADITSPPKHAN